MATLQWIQANPFSISWGCKPKPPKIPSPQLQPRRDRIQVRAVYPDAKIEDVPGGFILRPSLPPIPKTRIFLGQK
jgi:hypothetical protein